MMSINKQMIGSNVLVTTDGWFFAPDGRQYRAVFGELAGILTDDEVLGIKTNSRSTNWYAQVGNMMIAGCQIHYAIVTDDCELHDAKSEEIVEGIVIPCVMPSRIYNAN